MQISLALLIATILLSDSYLRYLSFRKEMTPEEKKNLFVRFFLLFIVFTIIFNLIFLHYGINGSLYKIILMTFWLPCLIIFILTVRRSIFQHIFVFGMSEIWALIQHNWVAIIDVILFDTEQEIIFFHSIIYLTLFAILLPIEQRFFVKFLPPNKVFDDYGKSFAFCPVAMSFGVLILWAQEPVIHSWQERFSRFYLPFVFLFFYRHILLITEQLQTQKRTAQNMRLMKEQLRSLSEYNRIMQESREKISVMRHDLRHNFRLIYLMLQEGRVEEAKNYIGKEEKLLDKTAVKNFCKQPLINAALSIYIHRAEKFGIKISHKINFPAKISIDESDFALLISNLLENAINASLKQPKDRRKISIIVQNVGEQFVLEVLNLYDKKILFDEKNYPRTSHEGHGLGMTSIKIFSEKYAAYTDFTQEENIFKVTMYWTANKKF